MRAKFIEHVYTSAYGVCSLRERESLPRLNFHRKFSNTLIIGSLLSLYLIRNAIFVRIFGVISFPSLVCPPPFQQKLSTSAVSKKGAIKCFIVSPLILFDNFFFIMKQETKRLRLNFSIKRSKCFSRLIFRFSMRRIFFCYNKTRD